MSVHSIAVFVEVAQQRSYRKAADRLSLEPSTVSKIVSRLEADLGCKLLARTTRRVSPTPAGTAALEAARQVLADIKSFIIVTNTAP